MNPTTLPHTASSATSGRWTVDAGASSVGFRIRHLGLATVRGTFTSFASIAERVDGGLRIEGTIDAASVTTGNDIRDSRLRGEFFDSARFPELRFSGTLADGADRLEGALTIRSTTRPVVLKIKRETLADGAVRLVGEGELSRTAFDLDWGALREAGRLVVADRVKIRAEAVLRPS